MATVKVCALIFDNEGRFLLQLRDKSPEKNKWVPFGGGVEQGESEEEALRRELLEELDYRVENIKFFNKYIHNGVTQSIYIVTEPILIDSLTLSEGSAMKLFSQKELPHLEIGFNFRKILSEYIHSIRKKL